MFVYGSLRVNNVTTTGYHLQTNGQVERCSSTIASQLRRACVITCPIVELTGKMFCLLHTKKYNVEVHRSIEVFPFRLTLDRTIPRPVTFVPKRFLLLSDDDIAWMLYARLEFIRRAVSLCEKAKKYLQLTSNRYTFYHDWCVQFSLIFKEEHEIYLNSPPLFQSDVKKSIAEVCKKFLRKKSVV